PLEKPEQPQKLEPCDTVNATMCDSTNKSKFFKCVDNKWMNMACDKGNVCAIRNSKVQCMDQATADAPVDYCKTDKATRCAADNKKVFQVCTDGYWQNSTCSDNNYCLFKNDKATCVDKAASEAVQVPCRTENATQCYDGQKNMYQVCIDHYWTNSTCAKDTYCLFRNGKTTCVDKATAEAPVQPCTTANATRCVDDDSIFQICISDYWTNSTCDSGNVCGMKQGKAVCHDPSVPLVDVPDQPCKKDKATQCIDGKPNMYQMCIDKLWQNMTCTSGNVCRIKDDNVVCVDKDTATSESNVYSGVNQSAFIPSAGSADAIMSVALSAFLAISTIAFVV
ncbi:hypothetical protein EC988_002476, partial [Linderina pennispora]